MKVVILAGGFGTRLQSVVKDVPKPMADIKGSPFLDLLMQKMVQEGASSFVLCVSYKKESIIEYFGDSFYDTPIYYSIEEEPLGTGGAIKQAFEQFGLDRALVLNGDTYVDMDYHAFYKQMQNENFAMVLKEVDNASRYGRVETQFGHVTSFCEKKESIQSGFINVGVYIVSKEILLGELSEKFSFEKDILEIRVSSLEPKFFIANEYFVDIGIPESYELACSELKSVVKAHANKALFLDRDGVINVDKHHMYKIEDCEFIDGIFDMCRREKKDGYKLIIITNQAGIGKGLYTEEDYFKLRDYIHREFANQGCPIDAEYFCPYHIEGLGKYCKDSYDRKPNPGMIMKAVKDFDIDLKKSKLIGDRDTDIQAGKKAGVGNNIFNK